MKARLNNESNSYAISISNVLNHSRGYNFIYGSSRNSYIAYGASMQQSSLRPTARPTTGCGHRTARCARVAVNLSASYHPSQPTLTTRAVL